MSTEKKTYRAKSPTIAPRIVKKSISQARRDIIDWRNAKRLAQQAMNPKFYLLQNLFDDLADDALLTSQINNRHEQTISAQFELVSPDGKVDDKLTATLQELELMPDLLKAILDSELYGYTLIELSVEDAIKTLQVISRQNIDPVNGRVYPDAYQPAFIPYRETDEYGKWLLEFNSSSLGMLNKTVPHILFKKFAQSCWSELCEIYGIPPRYVKTNTQDERMLSRAEDMLREMGAAAAFVIDTTEEFQFAQGVTTNGDVYSNLIRLCNNEISLLISGAVLGQDTQHGNYSKEETAMSILDRLIASDKRMCESYMNSIVLPAFISIGWLPATTSRFRFSAVEDNEKTWALIKDLLPYKDIDNQWLTEKFGIPVSDKTYDNNSLSLDNKELDFFL
jgi:phage gp29-like protein